MNALEILERTLAVLDELAKTMTQPRWRLEVSKDPELKVKADKMLLKLEEVRLDLRNRQLQLIVAGLKENEKPLSEATTGLTEAMAEIEKPARILESAGALLDIVIRVMALA
jgi:hypothetical protein